MSKGIDGRTDKEEKPDPHDFLSDSPPIHHTRKETRRRIKGIVASAAFEDMKPNRREIYWLKRLGYGKITEEDYEYRLKIMSEEQRWEYRVRRKAERRERRDAWKQGMKSLFRRR